MAAKEYVVHQFFKHPNHQIADICNSTFALHFLPMLFLWYFFWLFLSCIFALLRLYLTDYFYRSPKEMEHLVWPFGLSGVHQFKADIDNILAKLETPFQLAGNHLLKDSEALRTIFLRLFSHKTEENSE